MAPRRDTKQPQIPKLAFFDEKDNQVGEITLPEGADYVRLVDVDYEVDGECDDITDYEDDELEDEDLDDEDDELEDEDLDDEDGDELDDDEADEVR